MSEIKKVLNVGGNTKGIPIPDYYDGWQHDLLDIDPRGNPNVLCDARELWRLPPRQYDSIYCSHSLEHFYRRDILKILNDFKILLKKDGFVFIKVPDIKVVMKKMIEEGLDIDDVLYTSCRSDIYLHGLIYGWQLEIQQSGNDFFAHKTGFAEKALRTVLEQSGFKATYIWSVWYDLLAISFPATTNYLILDKLKAQLGLP